MRTRDRTSRARDVLTRRYSGLVESFITSIGRELSDKDIEALADEAERGYDLSKRPSGS
jgi:hypothetical protein